MSAKNLDNCNRWRNKTVAFRVSPEENEQIDKAVRLSGLTKQDYITRRLLCQDVVVQGNPRVYKALRNELAALLAELQRIEAGSGMDTELLDTIELIAVILGGLKGEDGKANKKEVTAPVVSVGADTEQSSNVNNNSITNYPPKNNSKALETVSMAELYDTVYPSKPPLIDGLLYTGTYLFAGASKLGKSFLMAQIAYHISMGVPLWEYPARKGTVLYLALEDDYRRLQERLYRMFGTDGANNLFFSVSAGNFGNGLDEQLQEFMKQHTDTRLIIIDTLQKVREVGGDNYSYANDYEIITRLKQFADSYGICILLVHHTRKQGSDDKFDMISGTTGLLGAADGAFLLQKEKRTGNAATLEISGRDQQDQRLYLIRNTETLLWELEKAETELWKEPPEPLLERIAEIFSSGSKTWEGTPTELCGYLGVDMQANALTRKLNVNAGRLLNEYDIRYENNRNRNGRKVKFSLFEQA